MSDAASLPASGLMVQDGVALRAGGAWAPVLQLTPGGPVPREDWILEGGGLPCGWAGGRSAGGLLSFRFPCQPPPTLSFCISISAASQGGACGVNKCPGGSIKGVVKAQQHTNVSR